MALTQLCAYGKQDLHLTGNPTFSYFRGKINETYTNFACNNKTIKYNSAIILNEPCRFILRHEGDLIYKMYLKINIKGNLKKLVPNLGEKIIKKYSLGIVGGDGIEQILSSYDSDYMKICNYTNRENHDYILYKNLIKEDNGSLIIPLLFWMCKDTYAALPILSLQHVDVFIDIEFQEIAKLFKENLEISAELLVDYISLDTEERRRFVSNSFEYLIEQVQSVEYSIKNIEETYIKSIEETYILPFKHLCKEIFWVITDTNGKEYLDVLDYCQILVNGQPRTENKQAIYFSKIQPYQNRRQYMKGVYSYSFSLFPNNNKPSGSINLSRIDNVKLSCRFKKDKNLGNLKIKIYAVNYNWLNIQSGLAALAYSI